MHQKEIKWIEAHAGEFAKANGLSEQEAHDLLTLGSLGMVDAEDNAKIQYLIRTGQLSHEQITNAQSYIKGHVVEEQATFPDEHKHYGSDLVPESSKAQTMFTVDKEQYYNHDYNPNTNLGGLGVSPVLEILPIGKGFNLGKGGVKGVETKIPKVEYDSKGYVISREPKSIQDQMVLEATKRGEGEQLDIKINDPKFPNHDKWQYSEKSTEGITSTTHYMKNRETGEISDIKFMNHGQIDGNTKTLGKYEKQPKEQGGIIDPKAKKHNKN